MLSAIDVDLLPLINIKLVRKNYGHRFTMIIGIFTTWDMSLFEPPESVFRRKLEENPVHPFTEIEPNVYMLTIRSQRLLIGCILCVLIALGSSLMYGMASVDEYVIIVVVVFIGFFQMALYYRETRTFVLDGNAKMYEFYKGDTLIYTGHYHNIYIRLKGQNSGAGKIYYSVVLNGYQLDEESITSTTTNYKRIFKLGRRLAHKLELNYFDHQDKSRKHVIRHRCPYRDKQLIFKTNSFFA